MAVALVLGGCLHGSDLLVAAQTNYKERDFDGALGRYRKLRSEECTPEGNRRLCCSALLGEAEALLALQERQAALEAFERCRQECPTDLEVRRKLYLAEHATDPEGDGTTVNAIFDVEYVVGGLGDREKIQWAGLFLDGELVGHEPHTLPRGTHELDADLLLEAPGPDRQASRTPVRLRSRQPLVVPGPSHLRLTLAERPHASLAEDRFTLELEPKSARELAALPGPPAPADPAVAAKLTLDLRVEGQEPRFPAELTRRGVGWKIPIEICVAPEGRVRSIRFVGASPGREPRVDAIVLETVRRWRYGAYKVDGILTGFCHKHEIDLARR
jgi:hypothetical protein